MAAGVCRIAAMLRRVSAALVMVSFVGCAAGAAELAVKSPPEALAPTSSAGPAPASPAPFSHRDSCVKTDAVFALASGQGAFTPLYGFATLDPEVNVKLLPMRRGVLEDYRRASPRLERGVEERARALAAYLQTLVAAGEDQSKPAPTPAPAPTSSSSTSFNDKPDLAIARRAALQDAAEFGMKGLLANAVDTEPFTTAFTAFYDDCADDLGISKRDQQAFHAIVLDSMGRDAK